MKNSSEALDNLKKSKRGGIKDGESVSTEMSDRSTPANQYYNVK